MLGSHETLDNSQSSNYANALQIFTSHPNPPTHASQIGTWTGRDVARSLVAANHDRKCHFSNFADFFFPLPLPPSFSPGSDQLSSAQHTSIHPRSAPFSHSTPHRLPPPPFPFFPQTTSRDLYIFGGGELPQHSVPLRAHPARPAASELLAPFKNPSSLSPCFGDQKVT